MAKLGVVDDEQFAREIANSSSSKNTKKESVVDVIEGLPTINKGVSTGRPEGDKPLIEGIIVDKPLRGRGVGNVETPKEIRKLIADDNLTNGRASAVELASDFGISPSSVSAYSKGATSTASYNKPDAILSNYLDARKRRLSKKSLKVLQSALDVLTPEKLDGIKARDASAIAKDMSVIAKNMESQQTGTEGNNKPQFVIYAPQMRDERSYDTIVVNDNF